MDKEYSPIDGDQVFNKGARGALFGWDHPLVSDPRVMSCQTLSGTGALRVAGELLSQWRSGPIYVSNPTWGNHNSVFKAAGLQVRQYRYYHPKTRGLDIEGMIADLSNAQAGSIVLLHTCAHNPTGVDPTPEEWKRISDVCKKQ